MVIFHSYVSLPEDPEGKSYPEWGQTSPFCGDERLGAVTVKWLAAESPTCCEWWWWTFPGPSHWTRILKCCRYYLKTVGYSMYICICAYIYIYIQISFMYMYIQYMHVCAKNLYISSGFAQMITSHVGDAFKAFKGKVLPPLNLPGHWTIPAPSGWCSIPRDQTSVFPAASNGSVHTGMHFSSNTCACLKIGEPVVPCHPLVNHNCHS